MSKRSKRFREIEKLATPDKAYTLQEAMDVLKRTPPLKFDQSVDISLKLGVDPKKSDQFVRGTVSLPNGTGRKVKVLVFAKGDKVKDALAAGAEYAGSDELFEKVNAGWTDFDAVIATPDMMKHLRKLGKVLGPRGLMPSPKAGTVTVDVAKAVNEIKAGKVEFKIDKSGVINSILGKLSFTIEQLLENAQVFIQAIQRAKPSTSKGQYLLSLYLSSTMGPGLKIDLNSIA